ncbi:MAG: type II toxin-antitoxin system RelB/DinJ family antitoxin [Campylobacterales bacterium]|nr:type II toxin-antitoxin system RelB/DinJ family antitoxin [Campylobacterales bacterium]
MALNATVRARVDEELKKDVEDILSHIGLSTSQAITLFLKRIRHEKGIPFDLKIPNKETRKAIEEANQGINMEKITLEEMMAERKNA